MRSPVAGIVALLALLVILIVGYSSVFTVDMTEQALVVRLGEPVRVVTDPGLLAPALDHFGFPLIETQVLLRKQSDDATERHLDRYLTDLYRRGF